MTNKKKQLLQRFNDLECLIRVTKEWSISVPDNTRGYTFRDLLRMEKAEERLLSALSIRN